LFVEGSTLPHRFTDFTKVKVTRGSEIPVKSSTNDKWDVEVQCMCVLPSTNICIGDFHNKSLRIIDQKSEILSKVTLSDIPNDICRLSHEKVAFILSEVSEIQTASVSGDRIILQERTALKMKNETGKCYALTFYNNNFFLGSGNGLVVKVNRDGEEILSTQTNSELFRRPYNIKVANAEIYVADYGTHIITRLNEMLEVLQKFEYPGNDGPHMIMFVGGEQFLVNGSRPDREWYKLQVFETTTGIFKELLEKDQEYLDTDAFKNSNQLFGYCPRLGKVYLSRKPSDLGSHDDTIQEYVFTLNDGSNYY